MSAAKKQLGLIALVMMIFTSVFGFTNMPRSFYLMGYAAIPYFVLGAVVYFLPFAFMMSEFGASYKDSKGGIYTWMAESISPRFGFIGVFMWYTSFIIWFVNIASTICLPISSAIFGSDQTKQLRWGPLTSVQILGIIGSVLLVALTVVASRGLDAIKKVASVGGTAVAGLNILLLLCGVIVLAVNGKPAQPLTPSSLVTSPNPDYGTIIASLSFLVFAIFAYGGLEVLGGLVDETKNAERTFPRAILLSSAVIVVGYVLGIFLFGAFTDWSAVLSGKDVNMGNVSYAMMNNMGQQTALALGTDPATAVTVGSWFARYMGLSMLLALTGAAFTLVYAPLKQLIEGTPRAIWPAFMTQSNRQGMPGKAMWLQSGIAIVMVLLVAFGGSAAKEFFQILIAMTNVSMTLPYAFIAIAYIGFKQKEHIAKPFVIVKNKNLGIVMGAVVAIVVLLAEVFTVIQPIVEGDLKTAIWSIAGPVLFGVIAFILHARYERRASKLGDVDTELAKLSKEETKPVG